MKRAFAILLALAMVLSLGITAFADEELGSITITNATIDQRYAPYKIFDAAISGGEDGGFTYSITKDNQFFDDLFGDPNDEENTFDSNPYFTYDALNNGAIAKREGVSDADIISYLKSLIYEEVEVEKEDGTTEKVLQVKAGLQTEKDAVTAESDTVKFENLPYGYYLITSTLGTTVTINSTSPDVVVIDKNQKPGEDFSKLVWDEEQKKWVVNSSANIGDVVDFQVSFDATNYNGEHLVKHYIVGDNKGDALWVEFNSIKVTVDGKSAGKGWYHCTDQSEDLNLNTGDWTNAKNPDQWAASSEDAGWYLIHNGYDDFDIVIPWLKNHTFTEKGEEYALTYPEEPESKYSSPVEVVIEYSASVEPTANLDGTSNLFNKADLSWEDKTIITHPDTPTTDLTVHALGITKTDGSTGDLLSGAVFEIFSDADCKNPVYVIPTDVKGVYILDDLKTIVSGENSVTSREKYAAYLDAYLLNEDGTKAEQKNEVVTQLNGKLVVLGLEKGTYYLKETAAPDGYNKLATAVEIVIDGTTETYVFKTDDDGNVVEDADATMIHTYTKVEGEGVINNKGLELPSTGGKGTMMLITFGSVIAMAFAVLLITQKKMTIYHD